MLAPNGTQMGSACGHQAQRFPASPSSHRKKIPKNGEKTRLRSTQTTALRPRASAIRAGSRMNSHRVN